MFDDYDDGGDDFDVTIIWAYARLSRCGQRSRY
jgi:hypothetical protein